MVYVCLWHKFREAVAGLGPSQGLCSGAVRKQACCENPPAALAGADGMPSCSRDLTLGQHAAHLQEAPGVSREEAVTDEVRPELPDFRNCLPCRLWCLIDCTLHETRSADDRVELLRCARIEKFSKTSRMRTTSIVVWKKLLFKGPIKSKLEVWDNVR